MSESLFRRGAVCVRASPSDTFSVRMTRSPSHAHWRQCTHALPTHSHRPAVRLTVAAPMEHCHRQRHHRYGSEAADPRKSPRMGASETATGVITSTTPAPRPASRHPAATRTGRFRLVRPGLAWGPFVQRRWFQAAQVGWPRVRDPPPPGRAIPAQSGDDSAELFGTVDSGGTRVVHDGVPVDAGTPRQCARHRDRAPRHDAPPHRRRVSPRSGEAAPNFASAAHSWHALSSGTATVRWDALPAHPSVERGRGATASRWGPTRSLGREMRQAMAGGDRRDVDQAVAVAAALAAGATKQEAARLVGADDRRRHQHPSGQRPELVLHAQQTPGGRVGARPGG